MVLTLELPRDLEERLKTDAKHEGVPVETYALRLLDDRSKAETMPKTGPELVAYWRREGLIGSRPDIEDSLAYARQMRREAEQRHSD